MDDILCYATDKYRLSIYAYLGLQKVYVVLHVFSKQGLVCSCFRKKLFFVHSRFYVLLPLRNQ